MSFRLDYNESIPIVIERLQSEHAEFRAKLQEIINETERNNLAVAISLLHLIKPQILRHAVEEEARLVRAIVGASGNERHWSIEIMQQHRRIEEFLQEKLPYLTDELPRTQVKREIKEFVSELQKHHREEEEVTFPLALKSESLLIQKIRS